jgi:sulfhydrogenase subunit gamma (sulfur reductase)
VSWLPQRARIVAIASECADTRTFVLALEPPSPRFDTARPGQFVMLSILGVGEAAFTMSRLPSAGAAPGTVTVTVRRVGSVTGHLFTLRTGARVGVRGPFGRGFSLAPGVPTLYVAGGCGLAPLAAAIDGHLAAQTVETPVSILYGARDMATRILHTSLARWRAAPNVHVLECVEHPTPQWTGYVGGVLDHLDDAVAATGAERAAVCGPPAMLASTCAALVRAGLAPAGIQVALERQMKCGEGHCGRCYVNARYVCTDGPVFSYAELMAMPDAFRAEDRAAAAQSPPLVAPTPWPRGTTPMNGQARG